MKNIITILILSLFSINCYATTKEEIYQAFNKIKAQYPALQGMDISLQISNEMEFNAYAQSEGNKGKIVIYKPLLDYFMHVPISQAAAVIGHELGHIAHQDTDRRSEFCNNKSKYCEKQADYSGRSAAMAAGYDCNGAHDFFLFLYKELGNVGGESHPYTIDRINYLKCGGK